MTLDTRACQSTLWTAAYLTSHPDVRACADAGTDPCVIANINMDMVGEDTVKTNGRFYMTRSLLSVPSFENFASML